MVFNAVALLERFATRRQRAGITIIGVGDDVLAAHQFEGNRYTVIAMTMLAGTGFV
jgi:hypothetical protein